MAVIQKIAEILRKTRPNVKMPEFVLANLEAVSDKSAHSIFTRLLEGKSEYGKIVNYVDDIIQKYNICSDNKIKQKAIEMLSAKRKPKKKTILAAEKLLDSVNEQNGLYTPLSNFYYSEYEIPEVEKKLKAFYDEVFCSQVKPQRKAKIKIKKFNEGDGRYVFVTNCIEMQKDILTEPFYYKLTDKNGKVIDDANCVYQLVGNRDGLLEIAAQNGLKDFKLKLLTKEERLKISKALVAHEGFHSIQVNNMLVHPEIGLRTLNKDLIQNSSENFIIKVYSRIFSWINNHRFARGPKLAPETKTYTQTLEQFNNWKELAKEYYVYKKMEKPIIKQARKEIKRGGDRQTIVSTALEKITKLADKYLKLYYNSAMELGAYNKQRIFSIKNDLLI